MTEPKTERGRGDEACARVRARLDERLDGSLAELEAARDDGHAEACAACAALRARRAAERAAWRAALAVDERLFVAARAELLDRIAAAPAAPRAPFPWRGVAARGARRGLAAAAALALLLGAAWALEPLLGGGVGGAGGVATERGGGVALERWSGLALAEARGALPRLHTGGDPLRSLGLPGALDPRAEDAGVDGEVPR